MFRQNCNTGCNAEEHLEQMINCFTCWVSSTEKRIVKIANRYVGEFHEGDSFTIVKENPVTQERSLKTDELGAG